MSESKSVTVNFPFLGILTLIFITLKLTHFIDWSWWWVLAPMWVPLSIALLLILIAYAIVFISNKAIDRKRKNFLKNKVKL